MTDRPVIAPIADSDHEPATKADLRAAIDEMLQVMANQFDRVDRQAAQFHNEILRHFKIIAEDLEDKLIGAHRDEISLIKDNLLPDHEQRLRALEAESGLRLGPRP